MPGEPTSPDLDALRAAALDAVRRYAEAALAPEPFAPGESRVAVAAKVLDPDDLVSAADAVLDASFTEGRFADAFRPGFARAVGREHAVLVGSGSQANLLATAAATSHLHERPLPQEPWLAEEALIVIDNFNYDAPSTKQTGHERSSMNSPRSEPNERARGGRPGDSR